MPTIFLIRHGESQSNAGLPTTCPESVTLTERGVAQAESIAAFLKSLVSPDLIITSSYLRSKQTAALTKPLFPSVPEEEWPVQEFTYLSSMHVGHSTVEDRRPIVNAYWKQCNPFSTDSPGSESFGCFIKRVRNVMLRLKKTQYNTIAVFSHEQFICTFLWLLQRGWVNLCKETMKDFRDFLKTNPVPNGAIVRVEFRNSEERWRYELITSHLERSETVAVGP
jgi:2,3-bisphosphoglycerate-dependent phosphoglycerate mutase